MRSVARWLIVAVVLTTLIALAAFASRYPAIESTLAEQAAARLVSAGATWASVEVAGRAVTLNGTAPSEEGRTSARLAVAQLWGVDEVVDRTALVPVASPFLWSAEKRGAELVIAGYVPSADIRVRLAEAAEQANPAAAVLDSTEIARGASAGMVAGARFAIRVLALMSDGRAMLSDDTLSIDGTALDGARFDAARDLVAAGPEGGVRLAAVEIHPPRADPYDWLFRVGSTGGEIAGFVPSAEIAERIFSAATARGTRLVDDRSVLASGAPEGFEAAAGFAMRVADFLEEGTVEIRGGTIVVSGRPASPDASERLIALLAEAPAGFAVDGTGVSAAAVAVFVWEARRSAAGVEIDGHTPSVEAQIETRGAASRLFGEAAVTDLSIVAAGEPRLDWIGALDFALSQLALLAGGRVRVDGGTYAIEGIAATPDGYEQLLEQLRGTLPASLSLATADVSPPTASPYRFEAMIQGGGVILTGHVPDAETRAARLAAMAESLGDLSVDDRTLAASGAPARLEIAISAALPALGRLAAGRVIFADRRLVIDGEAPSAGVAAAVAATLGDALPADFDLVSAIRVRPAQPQVETAACGELVAALLAEGGIQFNRGEFTLPMPAMRLIDEVAATLERCPAARVEIGGHTDSNGAQAFNRDVSQQRADAVLAFLVADGIAPERLTAVGYGESRPIASNRNETGRAQNRRIEFVFAEDEGRDAVRP